MMLALLRERGKPQPVTRRCGNTLPLKNWRRGAGRVLDPRTCCRRRRDYFTFMGSMTTPPCQEGVLWDRDEGAVQASRRSGAVQPPVSIERAAGAGGFRPHHQRVELKFRANAGSPRRCGACRPRGAGVERLRSRAPARCRRSADTRVVGQIGQRGRIGLARITHHPFAGSLAAGSSRTWRRPCQGQRRRRLIRRSASR